MALTPAVCSQMLGVAEDAPLEDVRRAYRRLARRLHPDMTGGDSKRFAEITAAYNVLTGRCGAAAPAAKQSGAAPARTAADDADNARAYAEFRHRAASWRAANGSRAPKPADEPIAAPPVASTPPAPGPAVEPEAARVVPESGPGFFARLRSKLRRPAPANGSDLVMTMAVDLDALLRGGEQGIFIQRAAACPSCAAGGDPGCVCGGAGRVLVREKLKVQIPPGAKAGAKLRLRGKGNDGLGGRAPGDLYLVLEPATVPGFSRDGANLRGTLEVSSELATHGGPLSVPTPWGPVSLHVPPRTRSGMRFCLRAQGLPQWRREGRGDLLLKVAVR